MATKVTDTAAAAAASTVKAEQTSAKIVDLRAKGKKWSEIATTLNMQVGKVIHIHTEATLPAKQRVKTKTPEELAAAIVRLRDDEKQSWMQIAIRTSTATSKVRSIYESQTGVAARGNRIGKGGRNVSDASATPVTPKKVTPAKPAATKAAKPAPARPSVAKGKAAPVATANATSSSMASVPAAELRAYKESLSGKTAKQLENELTKHAPRSPRWRVVKGLLATAS